MPANSKLPLILVVAVVVAVVAGALFVRRGGADPVVGATAEVPEVAAAAGPSPSASRVPSGPPRAQATPEDAIGRRATLRSEYAKSSREKLARQVATFEREQVDSAWAPQKEVELGKIAENPAFATAGVQPNDLRASCKSTMCRIDGSFDASGNAEDWLLIYMSSVGSSLPNAMVTRIRKPDGTYGVQIYGQAR